MKKKLIVHIGMGKTGTTALQDFFWENRAQLEKIGILYPDYGSVAHAHHLLSPHKPKPFNEIWEFKFVSEWAPQLEKTTLDEIMLSSEFIAWASNEEVVNFCRSVREWFDLTVVIYLRRQDNIIMANYNELVKSSTQRNEIDRVWENSLAKFDYQKIIDPWARSLGKSHLIVRPYEKQQFYHGDIRFDFMYHLFGTETFDKFTVTPSNSNPRLCPLAIAYKLYLFKIFSDFDQVARFTQVLLSYSMASQLSDNSIFFDQPLLSPEVRHQIIQRSAPANEFIAREYMGRQDGVLFSEPLPDLMATWKPPILTISEARSITQHIIDTDSQLVHLLLEEVSGALSSAKLSQRSAAEFIMESLSATGLK